MCTEEFMQSSRKPAVSFFPPDMFHHNMHSILTAVVMQFPSTGCIHLALRAHPELLPPRSLDNCWEFNSYRYFTAW